MAKAPRCKLCGVQHWLNQPHVMSKGAHAVETNVSRETIQRYDWSQRERDLGLPVNPP